MFTLLFPTGWSRSGWWLLLTVLPETLVFTLVVADAAEKTGGKEKEGGGDVDVDRAAEGVEWGEVEESPGDSHDLDRGVDLPNPAWESCSRCSAGLLSEVSGDRVVVTTPTTVTVTVASDIPARFLALHR